MIELTPPENPRMTRNFFGTPAGDARRALCALEIAVLSLPADKQVLELPDAEESIQKKAIRYDNLGDDHYDAASALIKSLRYPEYYLGPADVTRALQMEADTLSRAVARIHQ